MEFLKTMLGDSFREDMTLEEISSALEHSGISNNTSEIDRLRKSLTKTNSENADWKRKYRSLEQEVANKEGDTQNTIADLQEKYNALMKDKNISDGKARFLALGYSDELAASTADALVNGDMTKVFENQKVHFEAYSQKLKADLLKSTPFPPSGGTQKETDFKTMTVTEKMELKVNDPQRYAQLSQEVNI